MFDINYLAIEEWASGLFSEQATITVINPAATALSVQNPQHYRVCTELLFSLITSRCVTDRNANNRSLPRMKGSETSGLFEERKTPNVENG